MKTTTEKTNQRILLYADEVLEESKGVRPLYPIVKAIKVRLNISNVGVSDLYFLIIVNIVSARRSVKSKWG